MSDIPMLPQVENITSDSGVECSPEQKIARLDLCKQCVNFVFKDNHTICSGTGCNISLMTTYNFKQCPLEKW
jgi:hypothetical protein